MNNINNYIQEKLKVNSKSRIANEDDLQKIRNIVSKYNCNLQGPDENDFFYLVKGKNKEYPSICLKLEDDYKTFKIYDSWEEETQKYICILIDKGDTMDINKDDYNLKQENNGDYLVDEHNLKMLCNVLQEY